MQDKNLRVALIGISLIAKDAEHCLRFVLAIFILSLENSLFRSVAQLFNLVICFLDSLF